MAFIGKALFLALIIGGLLLWASSVLYPLLGTSVDTGPELLAIDPLPEGEDGYAVLTGIVVYDSGSETPVPYIAYERPEGGMRTKQLIFGDRGCSPEAGDIPCASGESAEFGIPEGATIRVLGVVNGDQIFVERIEGIY